NTSEVILLDAGGQRMRTRPLGSAVIMEPGVPLRSFRMDGFLAAASKAVELERWPKRILPQSVQFREAKISSSDAASEEYPASLSPKEAAIQTRKLLGLGGPGRQIEEPYGGRIEDTATPALGDAAVVAVAATDSDGKLGQAGLNTIAAALLAAAFEKS